MRLVAATAIDDGMNPSTRRWSRAATLLTVMAVFIFVVLVWVGAAGVRGSDQYWYVADVESLIDGRGVQTNEIYPVSVLHQFTPLPRPFVHNILNVYIVALPALVFGAYGGWIVVNLISGLLTAFLIFRTVVRFTGWRASALAVAVSYLLLPITVWLTMQPLAEASIAPLVALAVYLYVTADASYWRWMLLIAIGVLLDYCRESFILLLPLVPIAYVVHVGPRRIGTFARAAGLTALGGALWLLGEHLFEPHISVSYLQVLASGVSDYSSNSYFNLSSEPPTISAIVAKAVRGLDIQFTKIDVGYILFYLPFNIMALAPLILLLRYRRADVRRVAVVGLVFIGLHLTTATVVQNQFRYLLVATPPLLAAVGIALGRAERFRSTIRSPATAMAAAILIAAAPDAVLAWRSHSEGVRDRQVRENLAAVINEMLPAEDTVMVALDLTKGFEPQMLGYVLRPRRVLYVSDQYNADDYAALIRNVSAKWLLSRRDAPIFDRLVPSAPRDLRPLPAPFADWSLFLIGSDPWRH